MDTQTDKPKQASYKAILDKPLTDKQRRIAVSALDSETVAQTAERAGVPAKAVYTAGEKMDVVAPKMAQLVSREAAMRKILVFCEDILDREIDTPIKASDKVAAARLYAEIAGVLKDKDSTTINIGVLDLRQATTAELEAELVRGEAMRANAIDVVPNEGETIQ
jgi:hypothetical protein